MPEVLALPLETEQRVVGGPTSFDRVVSDTGLFLFAVEHEHSGVDVEDQPRLGLRSDGHLPQETIVEPAHPRQRDRGDPEQEPPKRGGLRITRHAGQVLKDAILAQELRALDPLEAQDHRVEQSEQCLADTVAVVALDQPCFLSRIRPKNR